MRVFLLVLMLSGVSIARTFAQADTVQKQLDSLQNVQLDKELVNVKRLATERIADSLQRSLLEAQVSGLKDTDKIKRRELEQQLRGLRQRDSLRMARQRSQIDSLRRVVRGFPVLLQRDTLFYIFVRQGSFTAQERAAAIGARLRLAGDRYDFNKDSIRLNVNDLSADILYGETLLVSISEQDALWQNLSSHDLAQRWKDTISGALVKYRDETSWQTILREALLALLVVATVVAIIYGINRLFRWLLRKALSNKKAYVRGLKVKGFELFNSKQQLLALNFIFGVVRLCMILLVVYLALPVLFSIFPYTRNLSLTLLNYILSPLRKVLLAVWHYVPNLITVIVLLLVFRYVVRFLRYLKTEIESDNLRIPGFYADWANPTFQIARILVMAFMLIVIFPYLPGSDSPIFKGVSVFMGVLFTFGSAGALSNVVAGLVLTYMRAFKVGDRVRIGDVTGDVIEKTVLVTRIRTIKNELISIPNSAVMTNHTTNYSSESQTSGLIINTSVTVGYEVPWRQVHDILITAATRTSLVEKYPAPFVLQTSLDDFYVSYNVNAYTREPNKQASIYSELHSHIQDCFNEAGVELMSPHFRAVRDGNMVNIPPQYLPDDYKPPFFRMPTRDDS